MAGASPVHHGSCVRRAANSEWPRPETFIHAEFASATIDPTAPHEAVAFFYAESVTATSLIAAEVTIVA
jgi:hypothetical protein